MLTSYRELPILSDYGQEATIPIQGEKKSSTDGLRWYLSQIVKLSLTDESAGPSYPLYPRPSYSNIKRCSRPSIPRSEPLRRRSHGPPPSFTHREGFMAMPVW